MFAPAAVGFYCPGGGVLVRSVGGLWSTVTVVYICSFVRGWESFLWIRKIQVTFKYYCMKYLIDGQMNPTNQIVGITSKESSRKEGGIIQKKKMVQMHTNTMGQSCVIIEFGYIGTLPPHLHPIIYTVLTPTCTPTHIYLNPIIYIYCSPSPHYI